jgi:hypothetical protein
MSRARVGSGAMDPDIWLPLATLVLGWAGAQVTEILRDRRTTTRERLARRAELQRTTLLELQEGLGAVWRGFLALQLEEWERDPSGHFAEASREHALIVPRVLLLASRVEDERVRESATALAKAGHMVPEEPESAQTFRQLRADYAEAVARIGELLRERY